jgi:hypothetical protein
MPRDQTYRAGVSIEDYCRACKSDRMHTVIAVDAESRPVRVACDWCRSEHNYRGGPRVAVFGTPTPAAAAVPRAASTKERREPESRVPLSIVSDRERTAPAMTATSDDLELLLRRIIREEAGVTAAAPAPKWRGGTLVLKPGAAGQEKSWPIETFFNKIVMIRNRLRTLEQQVNASDLPMDVKVKLQSYVSGCYGSLTSFNVLFADEADQFKGTGGGDE